MTNDSEPHRVPDRMSARYAAWDPDCPRAIPFGAALLVAGLILLVTATHIVVAVVCDHRGGSSAAESAPGAGNAVGERRPASVALARR